MAACGGALAKPHLERKAPAWFDSVCYWYTISSSPLGVVLLLTFPKTCSQWQSIGAQHDGACYECPSLKVQAYTM
jgi:hypothetical protein